MNKTEITQLTDKAFDEFWDVIAKRFPEAKSGDLSPDSTIRLQIAAEEAVKEWIANNVPPSPQERNKRLALKTYQRRAVKNVLSTRGPVIKFLSE